MYDPAWTARAFALTFPAPPLPRSLVASLERICRSAAEHLPVDGAAISVTDESASSRGVVAASSPEARRIDDLQFTLGEGACNDAAITARPVQAPDLRTTADRWPAYTSALLARDVGAVHAYPVAHGDVVFGVLDVHAHDPVDLTGDDGTLAAGFAGLAAGQFVERLVGDHRVTALELRDAVTYRGVVYRARDLLAERAGYEEDEALALMRSAAFARDSTVFDVAELVLAGDSLDT